MGAVLDMGPESFEVVEPRAGALVESLRAFGYSPETAVADLVDNCISAGASKVAVDFHWAGNDSWIAVSDNGRGMTEDQLREAMRPGSANPLDDRDPADLGRFGLGLKTASFSQCRRLVVVSAAVAGEPSARTWDLDWIGRTGQWRLLTGLQLDDTTVWRALRPNGQGTVVVWRRLDRLVDPRNSSSQLTERHFYSVADRVTDHLRITFHRLLHGVKRVSISVNRRPLSAWDPFLEDHRATQVLGDEGLSYRGTRIQVKSFVLPHVSRLTGAELRNGSGPRGWTSQQGFYVYRNRRLIVAGDWLGLGFSRDEPTKLARIRLDLPNTMDQDWQIDVRKSVARPPAALAPQLRRIAEVARRASVQVYRHRGKAVERSAAGPFVYVWEQLVRGGRISYRINRRNPLVAVLLQREGDAGAVESLLRLVEETVPVPLIILDHASGDSRQADAFEGSTSQEIRTVMGGVARALLRSGLRPAEIAERLSSLEPFSSHPELIAEIVGQESS